MTEKLTASQDNEDAAGVGEKTLAIELATDTAPSIIDYDSLPEAPGQVWGPTPNSHLWKPRVEKETSTGWQP